MSGGVTLAAWYSDDIEYERLLDLMGWIARVLRRIG